jgi:aminopeptidase N
VELGLPTCFDGNRLQLPELAADNELVVEADMEYSRTGEGLHRFVDPVDDGVYLYTQFEPFAAHRVFACFDQPDLKAAFRFTVHAPADWVVVSNGKVDNEDAEEESTTWRFHATPRLSTYVVAVVAGPYVAVHDHHGGIDLGLYCRASMAQHLDADQLFGVTRQGFDYYGRAFDIPYPFGKYDQVFVPEMLHGAMENAGAVTLDEGFLFRSEVTDAAYERRAMTQLHELAHMWFGDLVTMRWWDDLWLNESFAAWASILCQAEATRWTSAWTTFANTEKTWAYRQDQLPSTHPIAADMVDIEAVKVNFDGITYAKGAAVLKQLVSYVGHDAFITGLRGYFRKHRWGNTSLPDLLVELAAACGRDLSGWSEEWLETAGVNTMRPVIETDEAGVITDFSVLQEAPAEWPTLRSHRLAIGFYDVVSGRLERVAREEVDVSGAGPTRPDSRQRRRWSLT